MKKLLKNCNGFNWDSGNIDKNSLKHNVEFWECEQVFLNLPLITAEDATHSQNEQRYYALGQTDEQRLLFISFTIRNDNIRVISARDMTKKEREIYEKAI